MGRWKLLCMMFFRHKQYAWWAIWQFLGPIQHFLRLATGALDNLVFPKIRKVTIDRPVFVFGHPRSGTTFLQRRLFETGQASMFTTWELWFPSLVERWLAKPVMGLLRQLNLGVLGDSESGHEVKLDGIEEEEAVFMHRLDSDMLTFICPYLIIDEDAAPFWGRLGRFNRVERRRTVRYYEKTLRRQLVSRGW